MLATIHLSVTTALLAAACGFGAAVWFLTAHFNRHTNVWHTILYSLVAVSYLVVGILLIARVIGHPITPTPIFSLLLLAIIFTIPPAIQLAGHLKAKTLINEQRRIKP